MFGYRKKNEQGNLWIFKGLMKRTTLHFLYEAIFIASLSPKIENLMATLDMEQSKMDLWIGFALEFTQLIHQIN